MANEGSLEGFSSIRLSSFWGAIEKFGARERSVVGRLHNAGRAQTKVGPILIENGVKMRFSHFQHFQLA